MTSAFLLIGPPRWRSSTNTSIYTQSTTGAADTAVMRLSVRLYSPIDVSVLLPTPQTNHVQMASYLWSGFVLWWCDKCLCWQFKHSLTDCGCEACCWSLCEVKWLILFLISSRFCLLWHFWQSAKVYSTRQWLLHMGKGVFLLHWLNARYAGLVTGLCLRTGRRSLSPWPSEYSKNRKTLEKKPCSGGDNYVKTSDRHQWNRFGRKEKQ